MEQEKSNGTISINRTGSKWNKKNQMEPYQCIEPGVNGTITLNGKMGLNKHGVKLNIELNHGN